MKCNYQAKLYFFIFSFLSFNIPSQLGFAAGGIATDGTVGGINALNKPQQLKFKPDKPLDIAENLGTRSGRNLFHSFNEFNIPFFQKVTFTENIPKSTENVITRVTGKVGSDINGTLSVTPGGKANFYLINPNGVTFGPGGQVDVPGSIHISTADQLKFKDGKIFSAVNPQGNSLSSAVPAAFGFLGTSKVNNGLLKIDTAILNVKDNKAFDAVAGQISITDQFGSADNINSTNGEVRLVASHGATEISVEPNVNGNLPLPNITPSNANSGDIQIKNAFISISGDRGGRIAIWGRDVTFSDFGELHIINTGSPIRNFENGISIQASSLLLQNGSIQSITPFFSVGHSVNVKISTVKDLIIDNGGYITTSSFGTIKSGDINISSDNVIIKTNAGIFGNKDEVQGFGGNIAIVADHDIMILDGGIISTFSRVGNGVHGDISLFAGGNFIISGTDQYSKRSEVSSNTATKAKAGDIDIQAKGNINVLNGGQINNSTFSEGAAGKATIKAVGDIILKEGKISSDTSGSGKGGTVSVNGRKILLDNASISAASKTQSSGTPGNVDVAAIESLDLKRGKLSIENSSETTYVYNNQTASRIKVSAPKISLLNSQITTQATGNAPASVIAIDFDNSLCMDSSFISTESKDGNGGALNVNGGTVIDLKNSGLKTTVSGIRGNGGDINVYADNLVMETVLIQANTAAKQAKGGNIKLSVKNLIPSGNQLTVGGNEPITWQPGIFGFNVIQAAARFGLSGTIQSTAPVLNLSGTLANLGSPKFDSSLFNPSYCSIGVGSSLTHLGKGGLVPKVRDAWVY